MREIIRNGEIVTDTLQYVDSREAAMEVDGDVCVPCHVLASGLDGIVRPGRRVGVLAECTRPVFELAPFLPQLDIVVITFAKFGDGRGYSMARLVRDRFGFGGELRARGDVLRDQAFYLRRCGFNAFESKDSSRLPGILKAFEDFRDVYQPASDIPLPAWRRHELPRAVAG